MIRQTITIPDGHRLNRQAAAELAQVTNRFESRVMIEYAHKIVNAKSLLGLLSLGLSEQANVSLVVEGEDEEEAVEAILAVLK